MKENFCFLNGKIVPLSEAKVGVYDIGLLRGYGIYEGLAAFNGKAFRFADHWNRLISGAHILELNIPVTEEKAEKVIAELLEKNGLNSGRAAIRIILTGGPAVGGIEYEFENPTFYILAERAADVPKEYYENGAKLITYRHKRELSEFKTTNYIRAVSLQDWRKSEGAVEVLYVYEGEVLEASTSNFFIVKGKKLITPAEGMLRGITRKAVLEIAAEAGYEAEERHLEEPELNGADEAFITSSFKDIVPVVKIDGFEVGDGKVGPVTGDLMARFKEYIAKY